MDLLAPDVEQLAAALRAKQDALAQLDEPVQRTLDALRDTVRSAFDSEGASVGAAWPPLAPATQRAKLRRGLGAAPLVGTGALRDDWTATLLGTGVGELASDVDYAAFQNEGTVRIPARRFMPDDDQVVALAADIFAQHVAGALDT
jgi:phage gpG-like protein